MKKYKNKDIAEKNQKKICENPDHLRHLRAKK